MGVCDRSLDTVRLVTRHPTVVCSVSSEVTWIGAGATSELVQIQRSDKRSPMMQGDVIAIDSRRADEEIMLRWSNGPSVVVTMGRTLGVGSRSKYSFLYEPAA